MVEAGHLEGGVVGGLHLGATVLRIAKAGEAVADFPARSSGGGKRVVGPAQGGGGLRGAGDGQVDGDPASRISGKAGLGPIAIVVVVGIADGADIDVIVGIGGQVGINNICIYIIKSRDKHTLGFGIEALETVLQLVVVDHGAQVGTSVPVDGHNIGRSNLGGHCSRSEAGDSGIADSTLEGDIGTQVAATTGGNRHLINSVRIAILAEIHATVNGAGGGAHRIETRTALRNTIGLVHKVSDNNVADTVPCKRSSESVFHITTGVQRMLGSTVNQSLIAQRYPVTSGGAIERRLRSLTNIEGKLLGIGGVVGPSEGQTINITSLHTGSSQLFCCVNLLAVAVTIVAVQSGAIGAAVSGSTNVGNIIAARHGTRASGGEGADRTPAALVGGGAVGFHIDLVGGGSGEAGQLNAVGGAGHFGTLIVGVEALQAILHGPGGGVAGPANHSRAVGHVAGGDSRRGDAGRRGEATRGPGALVDASGADGLHTIIIGSASHKTTEAIGGGIEGNFGSTVEVLIGAVLENPGGGLRVSLGPGEGGGIVGDVADARARAGEVRRLAVGNEGSIEAVAHHAASHTGADGIDIEVVVGLLGEAREGHGGIAGGGTCHSGGIDTRQDALVAEHGVGLAVDIGKGQSDLTANVDIGDDGHRRSSAGTAIARTDEFDAGTVTAAAAGGKAVNLALGKGLTVAIFPHSHIGHATVGAVGVETRTRLTTTMLIDKGRNNDVAGTIPSERGSEGVFLLTSSTRGGTQRGAIDKRLTCNRHPGSRAGEVFLSSIAQIDREIFLIRAVTIPSEGHTCNITSLQTCSCKFGGSEYLLAISVTPRGVDNNTGSGCGTSTQCGAATVGAVRSECADIAPVGHVFGRAEGTNLPIIRSSDIEIINYSRRSAIDNHTTSFRIKVTAFRTIEHLPLGGGDTAILSPTQCDRGGVVARARHGSQIGRIIAGRRNIHYNIVDVSLVVTTRRSIMNCYIRCRFRDNSLISFPSVITRS